MTILVRGMGMGEQKQSMSLSSLIVFDYRHADLINFLFDFAWAYINNPVLLLMNRLLNIWSGHWLHTSHFGLDMEQS